MIYLVSIIEQSYATREMDNAVYFLNKMCKREVAKHIKTYYNFPVIQDEDFVVVADYRCHPLYNELADIHRMNWDAVFDGISPYQLVQWTGDIRFKYEWNKPSMAIGSYQSIWKDTNSKLYNPFRSKLNHKVDVITWKSLLQELPYNYSQSETQCYWGKFIPRDKTIDITYIVHGAIKYRLNQLQWFDKLNGTVMLGNLPTRDIDVVQDFVKDNPNYMYINYKMFDADWITLLSNAKYSIIADDDNEEFVTTLSARFWESVRADAIPLIHIKKDPDRRIYHGFPGLQTCAYFENRNDLQRILTLKPEYERCTYELRFFAQKYFGGILK